jgi:hypothetical protein
MPLLKVNQIASYSGNTLTVGTTGDIVTLAAGASSSGFGATYNSGLNWTSTLVTSALTVSSGTGYFVNTSTAAITVTLPASPTFGSIVGIADYSGYASTNNITINPNGNKLEGGTGNKLLSTDKESVFLTYTDTTRGWLPTSGVNNGTDALLPPTYSVDFLVVAGGGGAAVGNTGGGGAGGYRTSTQSVVAGIVITVTVGDGGASGNPGNAGSDSSISGSGLTTITSAGGGGGKGAQGGSGGSGGGSGYNTATGGVGNTPSTSPSQGNNGGGQNSTTPNYGSGGGGGASAVGGSGNGSVGGNGGNGTASSITGSSVTYAGGGGGSAEFNATISSGGTGGGGAGGNANTNGTSGTANLGGGGGAAYTPSTPGAGGKGVVILSLPTTKYSSTTTGSPTVTTSGSNTILKFTGSGSYTT